MSGSPSPSAGGSRNGRRRFERRPAAARLWLRTVYETSAGGIVVNRYDRPSCVALIARLDRGGELEWVLPKGHVEAGESAEQAAVREVQEETGLRSRVVSVVGDIDYWFVADNRRIHKTVRHFLLEATGGELSADDSEVSEVAWVPLDELAERLHHASERRLAIRLLTLLADSASEAVE